MASDFINSFMIILKKLKIVAGLSFLVVAAACSSSTSDVPEDPWESVNRDIFTFNEYVDSYVLKPVAVTYVDYVPETARIGVHNFLNNLTMPWTFVNSALQADLQNTAGSFWSFALDSTFGIGGLYNFSERHTDLNVRFEDFGQTMGVWGVGSGPYVFLPFLGPSTVRDTGGLVVDSVLDPVNFVGSNTEYLLTARSVMSVVDARARLIVPIESVYDTSIDPYATFRSGYLQRRKFMIRNSQ